jgi:serine O-acetyltransferase
VNGVAMMVDDVTGDLPREIIQNAVAELRSARLASRAQRQPPASRFPSPDALAGAIRDLSAAMYPRRLGEFRGEAGEEDAFVASRLAHGLEILRQEVDAEVAYWQLESAAPFDDDHALTIIRHFATTLAEIRALIDSDLDAAFIGDPAARSIDEILVSYPGAIATLHHRIAHELHKLGATIVARSISELANARTGIDIHPGAAIGARFFIDHGTGVVIGETAIIGSNVRLYQHVTLGARSPLWDAIATPRERYARHPIVEDDVVIYAGATILGRVTIGRGSTIGGNVWLLEDVPAQSVIVQPGAVRLDGAEAEELGDVLARSWPLLRKVVS